MLAAFQAHFFYKTHSSFVSPGCWQLQSTALSRRKTTTAAFQQLSALPPTKQGFPDRNKAFLTQQSSCSSIFESPHPLVFPSGCGAESTGIYPGGFLRFREEFIQTIYPVLAMHPSSSCLLQARPLFPAIELFVKVSTVCLFMEEFFFLLYLRFV